MFLIINFLFLFDMIRLTYLLLILAISGCGNSSGSKSDKTTARKNSPNIILLMSDDMGVECLSTYGSTSYNTPVLDQMAKDGIKFNNCISQPLCTPSRVKIMTGMYNHRNYVDFGYLKEGEKTFAHYLKDAGYRTMVAGKWQLNGIVSEIGNISDRNRPYHFGFDEYCLWQLTKKGPRYANPYIEQNGELLKTSEDDYGPDIVSEYIMDFIERNRDNKFFVYYPMILVHSPFMPTPDSPEWKDPSQRGKKDNRFFKDMVEYTDKIVGKLTGKLEELGIADNTIFIFTGDNGTHTRITTSTVSGEYPGGKGSLKDNGTHVPMVASFPAGGQKGKVVESLVEFSDYLPTFLEAAGVSVPENVDGKSFYSILAGNETKHREDVFIHYHPRTTNISGREGRFARTLEYKLYHDGRFYNMKEDKWEEKTLDVKKLSDDQKDAYNKLKEVLDSHPEYDFSVPHR
jgi:arylsulfatase A